MKALIDLIYKPLAVWAEEARPAFADALAPRYQRVNRDSLLDARGEGERRFQLRVNASTGDSNVPFAALIAPDQERSGAYGGMSLVLFPSKEADTPALIGMVIGTNGLAPDEEILGRPGHARKVRAISNWLRSRGASLTWAKQDPIRIDQRLPRSLTEPLLPWKPAVDRYGHVLYAIFAPPADRTADTDVLVAEALAAFSDLFFTERQIEPMATARQDAERIRRDWLSTTLPHSSRDDVAALLAQRKYVVLEGPPGTGKTELATTLLRDEYKGNGRLIQFHPGTTYESFIGGLAPQDGGALGFTFAPVAGHLMEAAAAAKQSGEPYLLVVDEINRADLAKVLGEAIHLFEADRHEREVTLAHDFPKTGNTLSLPANLHLLGTMNSADRSIASLDLAVRRRFAFLELWPQLNVVEENSGELMQTAFHDLLMIFLEHASDDAFSLMPGHAYFLATDNAASQAKLRTEVTPLLREYLRQGFVAGFSDEIQAWLDAYGEHST